MPQTDPPINYLAMLNNEELYRLWELRTARLRKVENESRYHKHLWPNELPFLVESIDRVEREMAYRNLPVPGEATFK